MKTSWMGCVGLILLCAPGAHAWEKVDQATRYLERSASLLGPTGWINIPSASIPESGYLTAAIHRGEAKVNMGVWNVLEGGLYFEADQLGTRFEPYRNLSSTDLIKEHVPAFVREAFRGQAKFKLLDQDWAWLSIAGGLEEEDWYVVAQRHFLGLSRVTVLAGWGKGRFEKGFCGFSKTIFSGAEFIFEYDGEGFNMGLRLLLAPNLILDFNGTNINTIGEVQHLGDVIGGHLVFGITYVERVW